MGAAVGEWSVVGEGPSVPAVDARLGRSGSDFLSAVQKQENSRNRTASPVLFAVPHSAGRAPSDMRLENQISVKL